MQVDLSNVLDRMPKGAFVNALFESLASKCNGGARIAHWGIFDPHPCPRAVMEQGLLVPLSELAAALFEQDRMFLYWAFHVTEVPQK